MKSVVQRVSQANVRVDGEVVAKIDRGCLALVGFGKDDTEETLAWMARKITSLRVFEDDNGRMSLGPDAVDGKILVVSQFTLYGDCNKGNRPSFDASAPPDKAKELYHRFLEIMEDLFPGRVESGRFQEMMEVSLTNEGPVTVVIER